MTKPGHILVIRFSALGDVAMTVPVLRLLLQQHPNLQLTFVSLPFHQPLFEDLERLQFFPADLKNKYVGLAGLYHLAGDIKKTSNFDAIADLHDVLRSKIIRNLLPTRKLAVINKGRKQKKELTRQRDKRVRPLKTTFDRYEEVFAKLGFPVKLIKTEGITCLKPDGSLLPVSHSRNQFLGVAPFAKHNAKMYPLERMHQVVEILAAKSTNQIFLFGSSAEAGVLRSWKQEHQNIHIVAGTLPFSDELNLISQMDVMVTMDSANMHLASLYGVPVVSVWGGTHPYLGFYGWAQDIENAVQTDLPCRPSSVFGKKDCPVHGKAGCMQEISPQMIVAQVEKIVNKH